MNAAFQQLARDYHGMIMAGGLFRAPALHFTYDGSWAWLGVVRGGPLGSCRYTQLYLPWSKSETRCEVRSARFLERVERLLFRGDIIRTDSRQFDRRYLVTGDDPEELRVLLNGGVQMCIEKLRRLRGSGSLSVTIADGHLWIRKRGVIRDYETLRHFAAMGLDLYEQAMLVTGTQIEFVEERALMEDGDAVCRVCGDGLEEKIVFCRKCHTPHHRDCWSYFGACSTYGCGETRFISTRRLRRDQRAKLGPHQDSSTANSAFRP